MKKNVTELSNIGVVVYKIIVRTPETHVAKLFIENLPEDISEQELEKILTRNGYDSVYEEYGIPWANHYIEPKLKDADDSVIGQYRLLKRGDFDLRPDRTPVIIDFAILEN